MQVELVEQASFLRAALSFGLLPGAAAIAWADREIMNSESVPPAVLDLAVTPPRDGPRVRDILGDLAAAPLGVAEPEAAVRAVLDLLRADLVYGRRDLPEAIGLAHAVSFALAMPEALHWEIAALEDDYSLVRDRIAGDLPTISAIAHEFFAQFEGASLRYLERAI